MSSEPTTVEREIAAKAEELALSFDPEAVAKRLRDWIVERYPARVAGAYWISLRGDRDRDRGIDFELYRLPWRLRLGMLLGLSTAGVNVSREVGASGLHLGIGAVTPYDELGEWAPVVSASWRF